MAFHNTTSTVYTIVAKQPKQTDFHFKISGFLVAIKLTDKSGYPDNGYPDLQTLRGAGSASSTSATPSPTSQNFGIYSSLCALRNKQISHGDQKWTACQESFFKVDYEC